MVTAGAVNKARMVNGWNMLTPAQCKPIAQVWLDQLQRKGINLQLVNTLVDMAIDYRTGFLESGHQPPPLTVELVMAMFARYKEKTYAEFDRLKLRLVHVRDMIAYVDSGGIDEGTAAERLNITIPFRKGATLMADELERKVSVFLKERCLEE